jgi:hypothetical protein
MSLSLGGGAVTTIIVEFDYEYFCMYYMHLLNGFRCKEVVGHARYVHLGLHIFMISTLWNKKQFLGLQKSTNYRE